MESTESPTFRQGVIEEPNILVAQTAAALRAGVHTSPWRGSQLCDEPRDQDAVAAHVAIEPPELSFAWFVTGVRYEGADAFLLEFWSGDVWTVAMEARHGAADGRRARRETIAVRPESFRNEPPWFTAMKLPTLQRFRASQPPLTGYADYRVAAPVDDGAMLVLRILVPAAADPDALFRIRIAYRLVEHSYYSCTSPRWSPP